MTAVRRLWLERKWFVVSGILFLLFLLLEIDLSRCPEPIMQTDVPLKYSLPYILTQSAAQTAKANASCLALIRQR